MNKQIRSRTWKYFRQQKWEEIKDFWEDAFPFLVSLSLAIGISFQILWIKDIETGLLMWKTGAIIGLFIVGFWVLIGLIMLGIYSINYGVAGFRDMFMTWGIDNWKEAEERAEKDFKRKKK